MLLQLQPVLPTASLITASCYSKSLTGKVWSDEEEGSAKKGEGDSHSPFGLDLRDDPGCDCAMLDLCVGQQNRCCG